MTRKSTDEKRAKSIEEGSTLLFATPGSIRQEIVKYERRQRNLPIGTSYTRSDDNREEKKAADVYLQQLKTAMLRSAMSATTTLVEQPASIWNPAKQRNKKLEKEMGYEDLGDGMYRPVSFSKHAVDTPASLAVSLSTNATIKPSSSLSLDPKKAYAAASFKDIASGAFATGGPSMIETPSIKIDMPSASILPGGGPSIFGDHTTDTLPMSFDTTSPQKARGHFTKAAKPIKAPEPTLKLMPESKGIIDLGTGRPDAPNQHHFRLEA